MGKENTKKAKKSAVEEQAVQNNERVFRVDRQSGQMVVEFKDGRQITIKFNAVDFAAFLLKVTNEIYCKENNREDRYRVDELGYKLKEFRELLINIDTDWLVRFKNSTRFQTDPAQDARWALSEARRKMKTEFERNGIAPKEASNLVDKILPTWNGKIAYPVEMFDLCGPDPFLGLAMKQPVYKERGVGLSTDGTEIRSVSEEVEEQEELEIPDSVTKLKGDVFEKCKKITRIRIPKSVRFIDKDVFSGCEKLEHIEVAEENPIYKSEKGMLFNKEGTELILVPKGVQGSLVIPESVTKIGYGAINDCKGITSIKIPDGVTEIGPEEFVGCIGLEHIEVAKGNPAYKSENGMILNEKGTELIFVPKGIKGDIEIPEGVTRIGCSVFSDCIGITSIKVPEGVTEIKEEEFAGCTGLTSITIPVGVIRIGIHAFKNCTNLMSITIPEGVVRIFHNAFKDCTGLKSITISQSVTDIGNNIGEEVFSGCASLERIEVADENPVYKSIDGMLFNKEGTELILVPKGVHGSLVIPESVTKIGYGAINDCKGITNIEIPKGVTRIGWYVFKGCTGLEHIEVAKENPTYKSENGMILNKKGTELIFVPAGIQCSHFMLKDVTKIGSWAFRDCVGLMSIEIPKSVTKIGECAFVNCTSLKRIYFEGNAPKLGRDVFGCVQATVYYRKGTKGWGETFGGLPTQEIP